MIRLYKLVILFYILVNLTNSISSQITKILNIGDEVCNVQHVSGSFICGSALIWPQKLFKNLVAASNSKSTQMLSYG